MMRMRLWFFLGIGLMAVSACAPLQKNSMRAYDNTKRELTYLGNRAKGYFQPYQPTNEERPILPSSYCYRTAADIICYRDPLPGAEERLVGYQEPPLEQQQRRDMADAAPAPVAPVSVAYNMSSSGPPPAPAASMSAPAPSSPLEAWKHSVKSQPFRASTAKTASAQAKPSAPARSSAAAAKNVSHYDKKPTEVSPPPTVKSLSESPEALRRAPLFTIAGQ